MFESSEEVKKAMMDLKLFESMDTIEVEDHLEVHEDDEDEEEYTPQIFPEHDIQSSEYRKTLYYGALPTTDRPSMPLTRLAVDQFTSSGLDALGQKLGRLDMGRAADISRQACAGPNSLVLALLYLDRLRRSNPDYLTTVSSTDLFLVSLMVASKFLHDDGEENEVFNDEWASSGGIDTKELNKLELAFLSALDWKIFCDSSEFEERQHRVEAEIAVRQVLSRDSGACYNDLVVLGTGEQARQILALITDTALKVTAVCLTTYAAGLLTLLGTAAALSRTPLGPAAVSSSVRTLAQACGAEQEDQREDIRPNTLASSNLTTADLVTASLLVTTLTSRPLAGEDDDDELSGDLRNPRESDDDLHQERNRTRALWLSQYSGDQEPHERPPDMAGYSMEPSVYSRKPTTYSSPMEYIKEPLDFISSSLINNAWKKPEDGSTLQRCPMSHWRTTVAKNWPDLIVTG